MNEELNLVEILKNVPKGTEFYCSVVGDCKFLYISDNKDYPISISYSQGKDSMVLDEYGKEYKGKGECLLFPSKDQRDWSKFKVNLLEGTKVMCAEVDTGWMLRYYASDRRCYKDGKKNGKTVEWKYIVPVSDFDFENIESNINKSI